LAAVPAQNPRIRWFYAARCRETRRTLIDGAKKEIDERFEMFILWAYVGRSGE
jgi:hypothetical protein